MKLELTNRGFKEIINAFKTYDGEILFDRESIPEGCKLSVVVCDDHMAVCVYRFHPYNEKVLAARADQVTYSNLRSDVNPTVKFYVADWTPEKLAQTQVRMAERVAEYNKLTAKYKEVTEIHLAALKAQRLEILGGQPDENL